jgi:predicted ATPase/transcriptional regulator with XRE-family HTH domain
LRLSNQPLGITVDYSFGNWVRRRRKSLDLTQQELAERVGCSTSLIFKIESDERRPSRQIAELLLEHLEIPPDQRNLFLKVARQEKASGQLDSIALPPSSWALSQLSQQSNPSTDPKLLNRVEGPGTSLPLPLMPIIGREPELQSIGQQLQNPACRLLTLTGSGGVGKTRLALEAARQLGSSFHHGVCFVSLISTGSSEFIIPAIADSLGFAFSGAIEIKTQLINYLKEKHILLVLDNLEHLLNGIQLLDELLERAPGVKILATSREQLNLGVEWVFEVQGLPVPETIEVKDIGFNSAVALFLQRAKQMKSGFTPNAEDLASITRICQVVEGLPLGLELAAAWVKVMSVNQIAREIERSVDFLSTSVRDMPLRHRSIRAVFDYSWSLLSEEERQVVMRLSIFRGFTRDAMEKVAGATLFSLSSLMDKSIVRQGAPSRYNLHELFRQYAASHLEQNTDEQSAVLEKYCHYYLTLLEHSDPALRGNRQKQTLVELKADIDNLRAAWEIAVLYKRIDLLQRAALPLWYYYNLRDSLQEGESVFERAAAMCRVQLDHRSPEQAARPQWEAVLGELLSHQAQFTFRQGRVPTAGELYAASIGLLRPLHEPSALTQALTYSGVVSWIAGRFEEAWSSLNEAISIAQTMGDTWAQAQCLNFMGMVAHAQGDYGKAYDFLQESIIRARALGDTRFIAFISGQLSRAAQALGRSAEVVDLLQESLQLTTETGDRLGIGLTLEQLAIATRASGDAEEAKRLLKESIKHFADIGDMWFLGHALTLEAYFALEAGEDHQAEESFRRALKIALENQSPPNVLGALAGLATLAAKDGRREQALETTLFVLEHPATTQETRSHAEKLHSELAAHFSTELTEMAQSRARSVTLDSLARDFSD